MPHAEPAPALVWSDALLLGFAPMDATHRDFVDCVRRLRQATPDTAAVCLHAMLNHAQEHFEEERRWMDETGFPATQCHVDEHEAVLGSLHEVAELLRSGAKVELVHSLADALANWFPGHADYMDAALSHWMCKRTFGGAPLVLRRGAGR